ncbi:MAG: hypothetical protein ABJA35_13360 [Parafilimonas sp.]
MRGKFPEPGVPADDAWKQMHTMLVENNLTKPEKIDKRRLIAVWLFLFVIAIGVTSYLLLNTDTSKKNITTNVTNKKRTKSNNNIVLNHDSIEKKTVKNGSINEDVTHNSKTVSLYNSNERSDTKYSLKNLSKTTSVNITKSENNNNDHTISEANTNSKAGKQIIIDDSLKNDVSSNNKSISNNKIIDTSIKKNDPANTAKPNKKIISARNNKFHFGLEWNADFSLKNNSNYFNNYTSGKQYYMWLLPSAWAKFDINKKHGVLVKFNPYQQQIAGSQTVHIEKPWIASVEPDVVTRVIKTNAINIGLNYTYQINKHFSLQAGGDYSFIQNVLYKEQPVEGFSGNVLSEKIYAAKKKDVNFDYIKPSFLNWNIGVQYNVKKISIGAGLNQSFKNLSADSSYTVRPLNGLIYIRYRFK